MRKMKGPILPILYLLILFLFVSSIESFQEFPIVIDESSQKDPAIYKDIVVWEDNRNGNWDIYGYSLSTQKEFQITTDPADQYDPAIYEDIVIWIDRRSEGESIYGYNLSTGEEFQIATMVCAFSGSAIYGDYVIWIDVRNVYGYSLSTREKIQLTDSMSMKDNPAIYGSIIIWEDHNHKSAIHGYNLLTHEEFRLTRLLSFLPSSSQWSPAIYGDIVVWTEQPDGDIYGYDLTTSDRFIVGTARMSKCDGNPAPEIYKDIIVWTDCRNGNEDICCFDLSTDQEFQITTNEECQRSPVLYENVVVWQDHRNGNWDIYGFNVSPPLMRTSFKSKTRVVLFDVLWTLLIISPLTLLVFRVRRILQQVKEIKDTSKIVSLYSTGPRDFRRHSMPVHVSFILGVLNSLLCLPLFFTWRALLWVPYLSLPIYWIAYYSWSEKIPYIRIAHDEIKLFSVLGKKPAVIKRDGVRKIVFETWTDLPYKAALLLSDDRKVEIEFSSVAEEDKKDLVQALKEFMG